MRYVLLTDEELAEVARACRMAAVQAQKDADAQAAVSVKDIHLKVAEQFTKLAEYLAQTSRGELSERR